jgi:hypothetical protein
MDTYVGRHDGSPTAEEDLRGQDRHVVALTPGGEERSLAPLIQPDDYPITVSDEFEWGYEGSGPINLAAAILNDALGFLPAATVVLDFCDAVVSELPRLEFELSPAVLQAWLDARLAMGVASAREVLGPDHL